MVSNRRLVLRMVNNAPPGEKVDVELACGHFLTVTRYKNGKLPQTAMCKDCLRQRYRSPNERKGKG